MNRTIIGILVLLALVVPTSALAESQTYDVNNMFTVRTVHVGDVITVVNTDSTTHSISGKTDRGDTIDNKITAGGSTQLTFSFPGQFSFYDKYDKTKFGIIYVFDPSQDLSKVNVFNGTSKSDLFQAPIYEEDLSVPNTPNTNTPLANNTQTNNTAPTTTTSTPITTTTNDSISTPNTTPSQPTPVQNTTSTQTTPAPTTTTQNCSTPEQITELQNEVTRLTAQEQNHYTGLNDMLNIIFSMLTKLLHINNLQ